jgi:UDP-N-acetylglucosamine--N-acetylmuramyl-(pentapeptide) pyrophosphoryl-undecaprenol N-acetylglucosamine transferase
MEKKIIISGGGTGGHIFPAVSIAGEIKRREPNADILFVGANGGMEMEVVPRYGYTIKGVNISGIYRQMNLKNIIRNLQFPFKLLSSLIQSRKIMKEFGPDAVVGVGGFASGPMGRVASGKSIPLFLCEQNAYPGLVNKWLAKFADKILLGNGDASKYFEKEKVIVTGNPIRTFELTDKAKAKESLGFDPELPLVLSLGGSLGARTLNHALLKDHQHLLENKIQLLWQCGKIYEEEMQEKVHAHPLMKVQAFIQDMATAYSAADLIISRAGASTISELIALEKPAVIVPSPNVAEDHQTKNALSLTEKGAAVLVKDVEAKEKLIPEVLAIVNDREKLDELTEHISSMEKHDSAKEIVDVIFEEIGKRK